MEHSRSSRTAATDTARLLAESQALVEQMTSQIRDAHQLVETSRRFNAEQHGLLAGLRWAGVDGSQEGIAPVFTEEQKE